MKSRPDILEQLDIRCWQLSGGAVHSDAHWEEIYHSIMVRDETLIFMFVVFSTTIARGPKALALERAARKQIYNNDGLGTYSFEYEVSDGSFRREDGGVIASSAGARGLVVRGEYGYVDPQGRAHVVRYVADSDGFRPQAVDADTRFNDRRIV